MKLGPEGYQFMKKGFKNRIGTNFTRKLFLLVGTQYEHVNFIYCVSEIKLRLEKEINFSWIGFEVKQWLNRKMFMAGFGNRQKPRNFLEVRS